jgi:glycolate oxidase
MSSIDDDMAVENAAMLDKNTLVEKLRQILTADTVLFDEEDLRPYECDALSAYRHLPMIVVLPNTLDQVQAIMRLCYQHNVPVIARGAGTGLSGGATPMGDGVVMSLAKFMSILNIDPIARTAVVQPGVRNLAISQAVAAHGLYYAPDPSSQIACTIGGNVAENSGGVHCLKYGLTVHNVRKVKIITMEGELLTLGSDALDSSGYDLLALINGSEGMLGVVVEVTVKLTPIPQRAQVVLAAFDDVEKAGISVGKIIEAGIIPGGLEMMDKLAIQAAEDFVHVGYPTDAEAILLCELDGTNEEVSEQILIVRQVMHDCGATEVRTAKDEEERQAFWKGRKAAFPAVGRLAPDYYCMDGTIPRKHLPYVLRRMRELSQEYNLQVANVFHAGDGNLHPLILYDANKPGELQRTETFGGKILELCIEVGGSITGEHGVGIEKLKQMHLQFNDQELQQFHALKNAFDPKGLLNPGKAVPTPKRCSEYRQLPHQHHNKHSECEPA